MELRHYFQILARRKWAVVVVTVVTLAVVAIGTYLATPVYSASATVRVAQVQDSTVSYYDLGYTERLINTYVELVQSRPFLEQTINRLGLSISAEDLGRSINAEAIANTELLRITVENQDPASAVDIADTLGQLLIEQGGKLYSGEGKTAEQVVSEQLAAFENELASDRARLLSLLADQDNGDHTVEIRNLRARISAAEKTRGTILDSYAEAKLADIARANSVSIVEPAVLPEAPSEPKVALNIFLGGVVGVMGGVGLAFVLENFDLAIYSSDELESGGHMPLLGSVPALKVPRRLRGGPLLLRRNGQSTAGEAFRILRTNIMALGSERTPRTLLITSVEPGAGKSTILANLAVALAQSGRRVIAVDSNFRMPSLDRIFGIPDEFGLSNAIFEGKRFGSGLRDTRIPGLRVLASGPLPPNPAELLGLPKTRELIGDLATEADVVLLDSPPLLDFVDAAVLAPIVDGVVLVVARGRVSGKQVQKAVTQLANVGVSQLGFVFNRAEDGESG
jgi:succinoglycan biosynthesis transport protein ExoP